jgi:DNA-binding NarL/FixJ family response regulator
VLQSVAEGSGLKEHVRLLLVEDHALVREGTREILERDPRLRVVGEADDGPSALALIDDLQPDIVLVDLDLPILNGIEVIRRIRAKPDGPLALVLSAYDDEDYVMAALSAGATGYLLKTAHADELISAIHAAAGGETVLQGSVGRTLLARAQGPGGRHEVLSERELEVLRLAAQGARTKQIAAQMMVSPRTVEGHLTSIFNKLGVGGRTEALMYAAARGWISLPRHGPQP